MKKFGKWLNNISRAIDSMEISQIDIDTIRDVCKKGKKLIFIGNGGSASIASHMAEDYTKNGKLRAIAFNDTALITCFANDYGYENVFAEAIKAYGDEGDMLIAISSSGKSKNILNACKMAKKKNIEVMTLSGFEKNNPLRKLGFTNHWVDSKSYGIVEITHLAILHYLLDMHCEAK